MKKYFLYGVAVIVITIIVLGSIAPKEATVERSIVINKPVAVVFPYFLALQNMEDYSPWQERDTKTINEYRGAGNTVGSVHRWISELDQVGVGEQEIKMITPNKEIVSELRFEKPYESTSKGYFKFKEVAQGTEVTWGYTGAFGFVEGIFMMFMDMDKILGKDFSQGLAKAKSNLEK
ncbi:hypothetical protein FHR24_002768 [Wenyingzhuangia heitensis]|uniref:Polyketide cyclase / dehydrase and lipid transport n=1 Tax=Wenyingzhuangia heitensis TaxID=1487859 RepID=A0ABX0UD67_9FLAO|nr:SRPBCC family protein [Wenyingzhuangia heitensis]NIJ46284.1 hypothetical protein [Wenyingzhuangia heitensis]